MIICKCLEVKDQIFEDKICAILSDSNLLPSLICDQFANYVVQSALCFSSEPNRQRILQVSNTFYFYLVLIFFIYRKYFKTRK